MFPKRTVFVLGAGASWHYGYPTGEALVQKVEQLAIRFRDYCLYRIGQYEDLNVTQWVPDYVAAKVKQPGSPQETWQAWKDVQKECEVLIDRLRSVGPLVIDHFLAWNEDIRSIGKMMIAGVILECEAAWEAGHQNKNRPYSGVTLPRDDWYRFVVHKLLYGCKSSEDLLRNKVQFVTFNYDMSLEFHLYRALNSIHFLERTHIDEFLETDRIVHVYGAVRGQIPREKDFISRQIAANLAGVPKSPISATLDERKVFLDTCWTAGQTLRTIEPVDKSENEDLLKLARGWLDKASVIYVLGFGFDADNTTRIGLDRFRGEWKHNFKQVMFTNYQDLNVINKRMSKLALGGLSGFHQKHIEGDANVGYFEKSTRNVYEALEYDFHALENE